MHERAVIRIITVTNSLSVPIFTIKIDAIPAIVVSAASTSDLPVFSIDVLNESIFETPFDNSSLYLCVIWIP